MKNVARGPFANGLNNITLTLPSCGFPGFPANTSDRPSVKNPNGLLSDLLPCPVFLLGFNDEQAAHFSEDWRKPGAPSDFYFVICERQSTIVEKEDADYYIPVFYRSGQRACGRGRSPLFVDRDFLVGRNALKNVSTGTKEFMSLVTTETEPR